MRRFVVVLSVSALVVVLSGVARSALASPAPSGGVAQVAARIQPQAVATPTRQVTATPTAKVKQGTVLSSALNVRSEPRLTAKQIGKLSKGTRVQILDSRTGWLQIAFQGSPTGSGWVNSSYVAVDGQAASAATRAAPKATKVASSDVPAPRLIAYDDPIFKWTWDGTNQLEGVDWYFDIQLYQSAAQDPYHVVAAERDQARIADGVWSFTEHISPDCDSYWVVQIAKRENGRFVGWVSPRSNRLNIGHTCTVPTPDCPGCPQS